MDWKSTIIDELLAAYGLVTLISNSSQTIRIATYDFRGQFHDIITKSKSSDYGDFYSKNIMTFL